MQKRLNDLTTAFRYAPFVVACVVLAGGVVNGSGGSHEVQDQSAAPTGGRAITGQWTERTPAADPPPVQPRGAEDASLIYDPVRQRVILYGGKEDGDLGMKETWAFDSTARAWEQIVTPGKTPPASEDHTTIYDPNAHRMILFGGENGPTTNKLWSLDLKTNTWKELTNPQVPRRESHSAVYDSRGKRMIVFGGLDRTTEDLFEVWAMDLNPESPTYEQWQNLSVAAGRPPGRIDHAAVYDPVKNRMVFHGGWTKIRQGLFGDTWAFYFADSPGGSGRWEKVETGASAPAPRRHAVAVHDPDRNLFVLLGGQGSSLPLNDVWVFDLERDVWTEVSPPEPRPIGRIDHQAVYNGLTKNVLLYGGDTDLDEEITKLHDVWELILTVSPHSSSRGAR
jgi:hypothetical protein